MDELTKSEIIRLNQHIDRLTKQIETVKEVVVDLTNQIRSLPPQHYTCGSQFNDSTGRY